jgi:hypothetical protein
LLPNYTREAGTRHGLAGLAKPSSRWQESLAGAAKRCTHAFKATRSKPICIADVRRIGRENARNMRAAR